MRKIPILILAGILLFCLTACGQKEPTPVFDSSAISDLLDDSQPKSSVDPDTELSPDVETDLTVEEEPEPVSGTDSGPVAVEEPEPDPPQEELPVTLYAPDTAGAVYEAVMAEAIEKLQAYDGSQTNFAITLTNPFDLPDSEVISFFHELLQHAVREDGELYWMLPGLSTTTYNAQSRTVTYRPYIYEQFAGANFARSQTRFYNALDAITSEIFRPGMTDTEKVLSAMGWLCSNTVYDHSIAYESYNAYSALVDKASICNGYMVTMNLLMKKAGIECYAVASKTEIDNTWHVWNVVKLNGVWYALDATQGNVYGSTSYHNFLVSDQVMLSDATHLESITRLGIHCDTTYTGDTPWKTTSMPFRYSEKYGALVNVENYVVTDGVTYVHSTAKYRTVEIDQNGRMTSRVIAEIPQYITSCTREYNNELLFITYDGDLMTYRLSDGACYKIVDANHKGQYVYIEGSLLIVCDGNGTTVARYQLAEETT